MRPAGQSLTPRLCRSTPQIAALLEAHVALHHPPACNVTITELGFSAHPYSQTKDSMPNRVASKVTRMQGLCRALVLHWLALTPARAASIAAVLACIPRILNPPHQPSPRTHACAQVLTVLMGGAPPKYVRSGATIPAMAAFQQHLNATTTVFAFGLPDSNMHAPNENFRCAALRAGWCV